MLVAWLLWNHPRMVGTGPAVVRVVFSTISRPSLSVAGWLVQIWRRPGNSQGWLTYDQQAIPSLAGQLARASNSQS